MNETQSLTQWACGASGEAGCQSPDGGGFRGSNDGILWGGAGAAGGLREGFRLNLCSLFCGGQPRKPVMAKAGISTWERGVNIGLLNCWQPLSGNHKTVVMRTKEMMKIV